MKLWLQIAVALSLSVGGVLGAMAIFHRGPDNAPEDKFRFVSGNPMLTDGMALLVQRTTIQLSGIEMNSSPDALAASKAYLAQVGAVNCYESADGWSCSAIEGRNNLAEVLVLSGLARTTSSASKQLIEAEEFARTNGKGIWRIAR
ncbi:hypothetical protein [Paramagnetospirillum marisnigri]|uniref:hypothetical protein n=1 Tax=Paramagnetospirillum marisnigri TaxID=1285242 RepID=UPI0012E88935|nr:hypothetical protein [Paramagnetospirillum marisnigri]